jgi:glycosyltransferase involved in cell wall biosynthesis
MRENRYAPKSRMTPHSWACREILIANHFALETVCGTTVMLGDMLDVASRKLIDVQFAYEPYENFASPPALRERLDAAHADVSCVIAVNAHIEVLWEFSEELFRWCRSHKIPAYVYAHDYWPQHKDYLIALTTRYGARVIASTPFIAGSLAEEGFSSEVVGVGVPLPEELSPVRTLSSPKVIASAGRLVPRKRLPDIVRAFGMSGLDETAQLYLRVLPSNVFSVASDAAELQAIQIEIDRRHLKHVTVDRRVGERPDYEAYSAYVCSSSYEGFSMAVIEAAFYGCPPLMSDILPHQRTAKALFGDDAIQFLFPVSEHKVLADLLRDEIATGRRKALLDAQIDKIRTAIVTRWSIEQMARALASLADRQGRTEAASRKPM